MKDTCQAITPEIRNPAGSMPISSVVAVTSCVWLKGTAARSYFPRENRVEGVLDHIEDKKEEDLDEVLFHLLETGLFDPWHKIRLESTVHCTRWRAHHNSYLFELRSQHMASAEKSFTLKKGSHMTGQKNQHIRTMRRPLRIARLHSLKASIESARCEGHRLKILPGLVEALVP